MNTGMPINPEQFFAIQDCRLKYQVSDIHKFEIKIGEVFSMDCEYNRHAVNPVFINSKFGFTAFLLNAESIIIGVTALLWN